MTNVWPEKNFVVLKSEVVTTNFRMLVIARAEGARGKFDIFMKYKLPEGNLLNLDLNIIQSPRYD